MVHPQLDFIRNVRNELDGLAEVFAAALLLDDRVENLAGSQVVHPREHAGGEALVVAEIEVGFRAVVEHVNLAVLEGRHRARIDVERGVEFLHQRGQTAVLEQGADGCRGKPLAE